MTKTTFMALGATILLTAGITVAVAQKPDRTPNPERQAARHELMEKLHSFAKAEVLPELGRWKAQLDNAMSPTDLAKLNSLRSRSAELRRKMMENGLGMAKAWKSEDYDALKKNRDAMKDLATERKAIMTELKPLALAYAPTLKTIGDQAKPKVDAWKEKAKGIVEEWSKTHNMEGKGMGMRGFHGLGHFGMMFGGMDKGDKMKAVVAHFMLWDGTDLADDAQKMMDAPGFPEGGMDLK